MNKWHLLIMSLMAALILFMALSFMYEFSSEENPVSAEPIQVVLKSTIGPTMDFWTVVSQGIQEASREFGLEVEISGPRYEKEISRQVNIMESVVAKKPPLIILAATDYTLLVDPVEMAEENGVPVITVDSGVNSNIPVSFIATDNLEAGRKAGREMKRLIQENPRKEIAIVSHIQETATAIEREKGVRMELDGEIINGTWFCDVEQEKAYRITKTLIKNPELGGVVALNEAVALGAARAIDEEGAKDRVFLVAFDNAQKEMSYLEEGVMKATVVQRPYNMGYLCVRTAYEYLKGEDVVPFQDTGSVLITRENMFEREYQELLFPFSHE